MGVGGKGQGRVMEGVEPTKVKYTHTVGIKTKKTVK
jgi:hypothetical protein